MQELDLKTQLSSLLKLQAIDTEIYSLKEELAAKPQEIKIFQDAFEIKKAGLAALEKQLLDAQKQKKDTELELASKEEGTKKLQTQLYTLKTNKEYQTMLQQIQDSKADTSLVEDRILTSMDLMDKIKKDADQEKTRLAEEEKILISQKKIVEDKVKEINDRLAQLDGLRSRALPEIDPKMLSQYDRILASRDGLAIVGVKHNSCLGCNMFVPPQVINLIKMYDKIITCEICNRMLYTEE
ncbi:MAG: C4-type zinc ribbon domain-containing protein [Candidatus Omnitrophica bacterium]|nr:C4-type zinc ribbon domain-containing protein [Candidatus Omnitrophota bacterium]